MADSNELLGPYLDILSVSILIHPTAHNEASHEYFASSCHFPEKEVLPLAQYGLESLDSKLGLARRISYSERRSLPRLNH